jgi:hypothetical protein
VDLESIVACLKEFYHRMSRKTEKIRGKPVRIANMSIN